MSLNSAHISGQDTNLEIRNAKDSIYCGECHHCSIKTGNYTAPTHTPEMEVTKNMYSSYYAEVQLFL